MLFLFSSARSPQATVPSAETHMLQGVVIHRLQSGDLLTMVPSWAAEESSLPHLEHLLPSFFPPLSVPSAVSFCSLLLPQWCFLPFLQYILPKAPPLGGRAQKCPAVGGLELETVCVSNCWKKWGPWRDHVGQGEKHEKKQYQRWPVVDCPQSSVPPHSVMLGVKGSGTIINERVKLSQGKGVLRGGWFRFFSIQLYFNWH